jgi:Cell division protein CrgA
VFGQTTPPQESAVPKSHVRKKKVYTPPAELRPRQTAANKRPSPLWLPVTAVSFIILGIAWLVVYYLTSGFFDVQALSALQKLRYWNLAIGFGFMVASLGLLSRWR